MSEFYGDIVDIVNDVISNPEIGAQVAIQRTVPGSWRGAPGTDAPTNHLAWTIEDMRREFVPVSGSRPQVIGVRKTIFIAPLGLTIEPRNEDRLFVPPGNETLIVEGVTLRGKWHEISDVRAFAPGDTILFWEVDLVR